MAGVRFTRTGAGASAGGRGRHGAAAAGGGAHRLRARRDGPGSWLLPVAAVVEGAAFVLLVGWAGSPGWRVTRVLLVIALTVAAAWACAAGQRWLRGLAALLAGILGTSAGIGIGAAHVAKAGMSVTAVAGLVALVTGLVLLGAGAVTLTRLLRGWWRLLAVPAAAATLAFGIVPLAMALYATNVPPTSVGTLTPASRGLSYTDVSFVTADNVRLSGWYIPSVNGAAVVLLHGSGSTRSAVLPQAAALAARGYGVLLFDARGHGRSGGNAMEFGWYGDSDLHAAVSWLAARPDVHGGRIAAVGMSMGGEEAIGAAASDHRIRAVVAEGAVSRVPGDVTWLSAEYGIRGSIQRAITWVTYSAAGLLTSAPRPVPLREAVVKAAPRPVLLIAAGTVRDEAAADRLIRAASPGTVQLWIVPGAVHTGGLAHQPAEWTARVAGFLNRALRPAA